MNQLIVNMSAISLDDYKLSCELHGHSMDVRSVAVARNDPTEQIIVSGSRDKTVKLWRRDGKAYRESVTFKDHKGFVACVFFLKAEEWICTSSNDGTVCIYKENSYVPILTLKGHTDTVSAMSAGIEAQSLITGSWDKTARVWKIDPLGGFTFVELVGHQSAIWAVAPLPDVKQFITGSADKTILYWNVKGEKLRMLTGHVDCVRSLLGLPNNFIVSAGNDSVIRLWNEDGECVREMNGHTNYIYSIAEYIAPDEKVVVSSGEDSCLRMWDLTTGLELGAPIMHPADSIWSVACMNNGDIVTGCSDGVIRVFTKDPTRFASEEQLLAFEAAVDIKQQEDEDKIGGYKKSDLPGPEILHSNGKKEGDNVMVRHPDGTVKCYQWVAGAWKMIGEVTGASGGSQNTSGKVLHNGKEYDFVFSVDISDSQPQIKLPYNRGDDPWVVAQQFIHQHNLPQTYLDQVANFIIKNSGGVGNIAQSTSSYQDPFTGSSRYMPGSSNSRIQSGGNVDPFTGSSSYSSGNQSNAKEQASSVHFPMGQYVLFNSCQPNKVLMKLKEFNATLPSQNRVSDTLMESVVTIAEYPNETDKTVVEALNLLLIWPSEILFPVLDITRLAVRDENTFLILNEYVFLDKILPHLKTSAPNQLMIIRCLANMMNHKCGRQQLGKLQYTLLEQVKAIKAGSPNLQIAIAVFYLNLTITEINGLANELTCRLITEGIIELLNWATDHEACYRAIQAIGNLTTTPIGQDVVALVVSADFVVDKIRGFANSSTMGEYSKLNSAATALLDAF